MNRARSVWPVGAGLALSLVVGALGLAGSFAGAACAPVAPEPAAAQPFNTCPEHSCDLYAPILGTAPSCECVDYENPTSATATSCAQSACVSTTSVPNVFLRVDIPGDSAFAPGLTFFVMSPDANSAAFTMEMPALCASPNSGNDCIELSQAAGLSGSLVVDYEATQTVGLNLGNGPMEITTLPVTATIAPLLPVGTPPMLVSAAAAGVFLEPPVATQITSMTGTEYPGNASGTGPYGALPVGFFAAVPVGTYQVTLFPAAPFDAYFPPLTVLSTVAPVNSFVPYALAIDPPATRATNVRSATPLDGLVAYLRNANGDRISTRVPLHGQDATTGIPLQLQTSGQLTGLTGDFFVIAPADPLDPGGRATFTNTALSITTGGLGAEQTYPQLPPPVTVAGQVFATGLVPTAADVFLTSTGIDRVDQSAPDDTSLSYATSFATDACGNYSVTLPPGTYSAQVAPRQGVGAQTCGQTSLTTPAQTVTTLTVATTPPAQNGKSLQLDDAIPVTGTCKVADGRALALATVVLSASTSLVANPGTLPAPRTFTALTQNDGTFSVAVDPGVYDVTVEPAGGSNLPWLVSTRQTVVAPSFALADQIVPAPIARSYTIVQPRDLVMVPGALVTAYESPASAADAGASRLAAVPVAQGITDKYGIVNLLFSGPPQ